ncbi:MAG: MoaD/ThiS family protein [Dehalococcoidia bacterium]
MKVEVKLFASLRARMPNGAGRGTMEMEDGATLSALLSKLDIPSELSQMTLINGGHCPPEREWRDKKKLKEGDVVSIFPPLAGG